MDVTSNNGLRDAKVGSLVEVYGGYGRRVSKVLEVTRVSLATKGWDIGKASRVWLSDGTSWTGRGDLWGDGSSQWSSYRKGARLILDKEAFDEQRKKWIAEQRKKDRRERLIQLLSAEVSLLSDEELEKVSSTVQLEGRIAARCVESFVCALAH
jgi:hypothetical protein